MAKWIQSRHLADLRIPTKISLTVPTGLTGGTRLIGTVRLALPVKVPTIVQVSTSDPSLGAPLVQLNPGDSTAGFEILTRAVQVDQNLTVTAQSAGYPTQSVSTVVRTPRVTSVTASSGIAYPGFPVQITAVLNSNSPAGGLTLNLAGSSSDVLSLPSEVVVPAGTSRVTFSVSAKPVSVETLAKVSVGPAFAERAVTLRVQPPAQITGINLASNFLGLNLPSQGTITLSAPAPPGGLPVTLTTNSSVISIPESALVLYGQSSVDFAFSKGSTTGIALLTASMGGSSVSTTVQVVRPQLSSLTSSAATIDRNGNCQLTVTIHQPAPLGGFPVTLWSSKPGLLAVPASVTIPVGSTSATFVASSTGMNSAQIGVWVYARYQSDPTKATKITISFP